MVALAPRRVIMATDQPTPALLVDVCDQLTREVNFARGLVMAIRGLAAEAEGDDPNDYAGAVELAEVHAERLRKITAALVQITRKQAEVKRADGPTRPPAARWPCRSPSER